MRNLYALALHWINIRVVMHHPYVREFIEGISQELEATAMHNGQIHFMCEGISGYVSFRLPFVQFQSLMVSSSSRFV